MAAIFAAESGAAVTLLESTRDGGRKILISGGGRCNILPARLDERRFVTDSSSATLRKILRSWPLAEQIAWLERELGLRLVEEVETGKLFPESNRARDVRNGLHGALTRRGATIRFDARVTELEPAGKAWRLRLATGETLQADRVILASGGLSVPTTGSDGAGLAMARRLGHTCHPTYPALTPLTTDQVAFHALSGVSLRVALTAESPSWNAESRGGFLFTHRGYSGPSVLDVSHVMVRAQQADEPGRLRVRWAEISEAEWETDLTGGGTRTLLGTLRARIPERLSLLLLERSELDPALTLSQLTRAGRLRLLDHLTRFLLPCSGNEGYRKAEVTGGGVSLAEIHPGTMESRRCPGLFLCGEILDAFGPIGGYNFLWAWVTGRAAGMGAGRKDGRTVGR